MAIIPLPKKAVFEDKKANSAKLVIEPLYPGYGTTMGNLLRRVLLSSLGGVAINKIKVANVDHEFSSLEHIKEDAVEMILNIKKIRLKANTPITEPVKLTLNVSGEKTVTAGDIEAPSEVEVVNPDQIIVTMTDKAAKFEAEFTVAAGRGYESIEMQPGGEKEVGVIAIDAQYSPVVKVGIELHNVRVDKMTNYDSLTLEIVTDGTRTPEEAVKESIDIIREQLEFIYSGQDNSVAEESSEENDQDGESADVNEEQASTDD